MIPEYSAFNPHSQINVKFSDFDMHTGITVEERKEVTQELSSVLAQTYLLYLKTQNYHWNVTGYLFGILHQTFEDQYKEMAEAVDTIAERIRALGAFAPATFRQFAELVDTEEDMVVPTAEAMVQNLIDAN